MSQTPREALEQIYGVGAFESFVRELRENVSQSQDAPHTDNRSWDEKRMADPHKVVKRDEEAKKVADKPILTGDPEWDAMELAETADDKEPLVLWGDERDAQQKNQHNS